MTSISQDTWDKLSRPSGEKLIARVALPEISDQVLCALDGKGKRHLLIKIKPDDIEYYDNQSRGVKVITNELIIHGKTSEKYLDIECSDIEGYPFLDLIGGEIAFGINDGKKQPADTVKSVLSKWRRFWGQLPKQLLSKEEQIGLFAELWFLSNWLIPKTGTLAVKSWRGPWGSRHDFEWSDKSVEVKATTNTHGRIHHINDLRQLENPENGPLFLFSLLLREETGAINNLPALVESCRKQVANTEEEFQFENGLVQVGYNSMHQEEYSKLNIHIIEDCLFIVEKDFPRITTEDLPFRLPAGIEHIEYEINLNTFDHLIISRKPEEFNS